MIFHKKIFQCVTAPIPLFQTPQKIGLLNRRQWRMDSDGCELQKLLLIDQGLTESSTTTRKITLFDGEGGWTVNQNYNYTPCYILRSF